MSEASLRRWSIRACAAAGLIGIELVLTEIQLGETVPFAVFDNIFRVLYGRHELPFMIALLAFAIFAGFASRGADSSTAPSTHPPSLRASLALAAAVLLAALAIGAFALHGYPLAMDEFNAQFQALIFSRGQLSGTPLPDALVPFAKALTPVFVTLRDGRSWISTYLPGYAALRAPFALVHAGWLLNPLLGAAAVLLVRSVALQLWPEAPARAWLAMALLATSSQLLFMSGSTYAYPAHLAANLLWLHLYLRRDARGALLLPLVGLLAVNLHQPFPHLLFAAPLSLLAIRDRKWTTLGYWCAVYLVALLFASGWWRFVNPLQLTRATSYFQFFSWPQIKQWMTFGMSASLIASWQTPLFTIGLFASALRFRVLAAVERAILISVLLALAFYLFFLADQQHGWGYRYAYPVLGNLALLGARGLDELREGLERRTAVLIASVSLGLTLLFQLPLRAFQVERFVRPFACASDRLAALPTDFGVIDIEASWYGRDLVRNDPFLRGGKLVASTADTTLDFDALRRAGSVTVVDSSLLESCGLNMRARPLPRPRARR